MSAPIFCTTTRRRGTGNDNTVSRWPSFSCPAMALAPYPMVISRMISGKKFAQTLAFSHPTGDVSEPEMPKSADIWALFLVRLSSSDEFLNDGYRATITTT